MTPPFIHPITYISYLWSQARHEEENARKAERLAQEAEKLKRRNMEDIKRYTKHNPIIPELHYTTTT